MYSFVEMEAKELNALKINHCHTTCIKYTIGLFVNFPYMVVSMHDRWWLACEIHCLNASLFILPLHSNSNSITLLVVLLLSQKNNLLNRHNIILSKERHRMLLVQMVLMLVLKNYFCDYIQTGMYSYDLRFLWTILEN